MVRVVAAFTILGALLTGCSTPSNTRAPAPSQPPAASTPRSVPAPSTAPSSSPRGGAYYKDDGPEAAPPPNLDQTTDAVPRDEPLHRGANRPYTVFGKQYVPDTSGRLWSQRGVASWYGKKFHGQKTSSGEIYDMYQMTAAHPTMPIPSYARVTNPKNGVSVVVRVNDRGPFHSNRIMDLSYTAALKLGYINQGSALVEVQQVRAGDVPPVARAATPAPIPAPAPVEVAPRAAPVVPLQPSPVAVAPSAPIEDRAAAPLTAPPSASAEGIYLQLGAFATRANAEAMKERVQRDLPWLTEPATVVTTDQLFRVHVGPYPSRAEAGSIAERMRQNSTFSPSFVVK